MGKSKDDFGAEVRVGEFWFTKIMTLASPLGPPSWAGMNRISEELGRRERVSHVNKV